MLLYSVSVERAPGKLGEPKVLADIELTRDGQISASKESDDDDRGAIYTTRNPLPVPILSSLYQFPSPTQFFRKRIE